MHCCVRNIARAGRSNRALLNRKSPRQVLPDGDFFYISGEPIEWDGRKLKTNNERANALLRKEYRKGWKV